MRLLGRKLIKDFAIRHRNAENPLKHWVKIVENSTWKKFSDVKQTFNHADAYSKEGKKYVIFNIAGNHFRLVTAINYKGEIVVIKIVMTHSEYSKDKWKEKL